MTLPTKIFIGLVVGAVTGIAANVFAPDNPTIQFLADNVAKPGGQIFLRMLFMVVIPLILASLALGVASLGDLKKLGRVASHTLVYFVGSTMVAATIGLVLVNLIEPGKGLDPHVRDELMSVYASQASAKVEAGKAEGFGVNTFVEIVPRNPVEAMAKSQALSVIFFALMLGVALTIMKRERAEPLIRVLDTVNEAMGILIDIALKLAPYGVAFLLFTVTAQFGVAILEKLGMYVIVVLTGLVLHQVVVLSLAIRWLGRMSPLTFYQRARTVMITAFSTSSSAATLPTSIHTAVHELGVPSEVAGFVLPLGATMNMNGTSLFEGVTVLFLAQVFGVDLSLTQQIIVVALSVLTAIGAAGVPSGSIPLLAMVLTTVGMDGGAIALILGADRVLDMCRTVLNVTGDLAAALYITRVDTGKPAVPPERPDAPEGERAERSAGAS